MNFALGTFDIYTLESHIRRTLLSHKLNSTFKRKHTHTHTHSKTNIHSKTYTLKNTLTQALKHAD